MLSLQKIDADDSVAFESADDRIVVSFQNGADQSHNDAAQWSRRGVFSEKNGN